MSNFKESTARERALSVLRTIMERPNGYTVKQLAEYHGVSPDVIKDDFAAIKKAGFEVVPDNKYRYAIAPDKQYEHLKELLFFPEKDQDFLLKMLKNVPNADKQKERIIRKLESIYDFTRLGSNLISNQLMTKINLLEQAQKTEKIVTLLDYRSTDSGDIKDKNIEVFHVMPKEDILHAFDIDKKAIRHYRISRIAGVEITNTPWIYGKDYHNIIATDPFRIANADQVQVRIWLKIGGYNEITERFPLTLAHLRRVAHKKNIFELDCKVNARFYGLSNFILGNHQYIEEILEPESLIEHIKNEAKKIFSNF